MDLEVNSQSGVLDLLKLVRFSYECSSTRKHTGQLQKSQPLIRLWTSTVDRANIETCGVEQILNVFGRTKTLTFALSAQ
jgi:hypothetical protein